MHSSQQDALIQVCKIGPEVEDAVLSPPVPEGIALELEQAWEAVGGLADSIRNRWQRAIKLQTARFQQRRTSMIRNLGKLFLALCLLTVGGGVVANAQIASGTTIEASVPFTFVVGDTTLPAGKYEIKVLDGDSTNVLELRSVSGHTSVVFDTENANLGDDQYAKRGELVFDRIGDKYSLSQVWSAGSSSGSELVKSRMEKRLEGSGMKSERHSIAANLKKS